MRDIPASGIQSYFLLSLIILRGNKNYIHCHFYNFYTFPSKKIYDSYGFRMILMFLQGTNEYAKENVTKLQNAHTMK